MNDFSKLVLYEDNHLLVVCKPPGLLAQGDSSRRPCLLDLAREYLKTKYQKPGAVFLGLVHRLDRQAAGLVVLARTSKAASRLSAQFRDRAIKKKYWAVISGGLIPSSGSSEIYLVRNGSKSYPVNPETDQARQASLDYRTLQTGRRSSLVEIDLHTGRKHQIRAQLAYLGAPIFGDTKYGSPVPPEADSIALLAQYLEFVHPTQDRRLAFETPPPPGWPWLPLK
ncbi:MAG: RNA pseudouridine synthase [Pseudomonadota bacterium]